MDADLERLFGAGRRVRTHDLRTEELAYPRSILGLLAKDGTR